jgi:Ca2+:H+ antiporter
VWCAIAEAVAECLGEPYGTLVLTLSVIIIEVALLAAIMLHGQKQSDARRRRNVRHPHDRVERHGWDRAADGRATLLGAGVQSRWSPRVIIASLAVFALIIPNYTKTEPDPSQAPMKAVLFASITVLFYIVFVIIQTARHRAFFAEPSHSHSHEPDALHGGSRGSSLAFHVALLLLTLIPIVLLSKSRAIGIENLGFPAPLGGVMIAILVLSPEGLTAFHAALVNHLQRAVNVCLGSALATIGLTIPAVLIIGLITGYEVHLGLDEVQTILLILTLFVSGLTFGGVRTNVLQGTVHILLFIVYVALIFSP